MRALITVEETGGIYETFADLKLDIETMVDQYQLPVDSVVIVELTSGPGKEGSSPTGSPRPATSEETT